MQMFSWMLSYKNTKVLKDSVVTIFAPFMDFLMEHVNNTHNRICIRLVIWTSLDGLCTDILANILNELRKSKKI